MSKLNEPTIKIICDHAIRIGLEPAIVLAIVLIESAGRIFAWIDGRPEPLIRFEGHYFHRLLSEPNRQIALSQGLASPKAGDVKNPPDQSDRWSLLFAAMAIDQSAALQSTSWGVGQVMGIHWQLLGFTSPQSFVAHARSGFSGQLDLMMRFIEKNGLLPLLQNHQWAAFARRYNGPNYKKNAYDKKLAKAYHTFCKAYPQTTSPKSLKLGAKGDTVKTLQQQLAASGYHLAIDGIYGPKTLYAHLNWLNAPQTTANFLNAPKGQANTTISVLRKIYERLAALIDISVLSNRFK